MVDERSSGPGVQRQTLQLRATRVTGRDHNAGVAPQRQQQPGSEHRQGLQLLALRD